jgi:hypothetical protein
MYGAVEIRMDPGMWLRPVSERLDAYRLAPGESRVVSVSFDLPRLSPEAELRIRIGQPESDRDVPLHIPEPVLVRAISLGKTPEARRFIDRFTMLRTARLALYALKGSLAATELPTIAAARDSALVRLAELLRVSPPPGLDLVFYPDSASKTTDTHHSGAGWSTGTIIVEIYNAQEKVDPYHELAHAVASQLGGPMPAFNEGFATYASELLGSDALALLGAAGKKVDQAACEASRSGRLFSLTDLLALPDIGSVESRSEVSYPESASVVRFLIETYGIDRFRTGYRELQDTGDSTTVRINRGIFGRTFEPIERVEARWLARIAASCGPSVPPAGSSRHQKEGDI